MDGLAVGRIVHYVAYGTPNGEYAQGAHRAAIVVELSNKAEVAEIGRCGLLIFNPTGMHFNWATYSEEPLPGTWHWPEKA